MEEKRFYYKKKLGQNFLVDKRKREEIIILSKVSKDDYVLEIGAGSGAITKGLCEESKYVIAVEIDKDIIPKLLESIKNFNNISIMTEDIMKIDIFRILNVFAKKGFTRLKDHIKVVANLPYYITSPIIVKLLLMPHISEITVMVQKEVADRICAFPGTKNFGVLTLLCNYFGVATKVLDVPKECFYPVPKVDSTVIRIVKNTDVINLDNPNNFTIEENEDYNKLFNVIHAAFETRRKTLINALSVVALYDKKRIHDALIKIGVDPMSRAENLSLDDYINLTKIIAY